MVPVVPLPKSDWPPPSAVAVYRQIDHWRELWAHTNSDPNLHNISAGYWSRFSDWWRGTGQTPPTVRENITVSGNRSIRDPALADLSTLSSDLLFGEKPTIVMGSDPHQAQLDHIVDQQPFWSVLAEAAEIAASLGGVYLRPVWDKKHADVPSLTAIPPDRVVSHWWHHQKLVGAVIWDQLDSDDSSTWRHLEIHQLDDRGMLTIEHRLAQGTPTNLGEYVSLEQHPETAGLTERIPLKIRGMDISYVPNLKPNRQMPMSAYGRSDIAGSETLLPSLDDSWTSLWRDIDLGRARILVSEDYFRKIDGHTTFDADAQVFTQLRMPSHLSGRTGGMAIESVQFEIRTEQHIQTIVRLWERIISNAGYSAHTFGMGLNQTNQAAPESGTALRIRERRTYQTRAKKRRYWEHALTQVVGSMLQIDRIVYGRPRVSSPPLLEWANVETHGLGEASLVVNLLRSAQAASTRTRVGLIHPDWSDEEIDEEAALVMEEDDLGGTPDEEPPPDEGITPNDQ